MNHESMLRFGRALVIIGCFLTLIGLIAGCIDQQPAPPDRKVNVEVKLDDKPIPRVSDARVIVLPTGERVLVLTGPDGMAACCLLPPKPEVQVEKKP